MWTRFKTWFIAWQRGYFRPLPVLRSEWFFMRLAFAAVVFHSFLDWHPYDFESQPHPTGIARFVSLTFLHSEHAHATIRIITTVALVAYLTGFRMAMLVSLTVLTVCSTLVRTYANSQGFTHHGYQIVTLTLLAQAIVVWYVSIRDWRGQKWKPKSGLSLASYLVYYSQAVILSGYFLAALSKIMNSKGMWLLNARYISLDLVKSHRTAFYKSLDPEHAELPASAVWMLNHPFMATVVFGSGFFLELIALIGLRNRRWALFMGISLILFHRGVLVMMKLQFLYNEALLLIFLVNIPFWILWMSSQRTRTKLSLPSTN